MSPTVECRSDTDDVVARLNATAKITDLTSDDRSKLLKAANNLITTLDNPVHQLMTIAKWPVGHGALRVALKIKLFEHFDEKRKTLEELETFCGVERALLVRIMRALLCMNIFEENGDGCYTHNHLSESLRDATIRAMIQGMADTTDVMSQLPDYLETLGFRNPDDRNKSLFGFAKKTELNMYEWLQTQPERLRIFHDYHEANALLNEQNLQKNLEYLLGSNNHQLSVGKELGDSSEQVLFVDIGGGHGQSLKAFRRHMPALRGRMILQDLPRVVQGQSDKDGVEQMAYDFFKPQPIKGASIYFLRFVLHNWPESACREILQNTISAMDPRVSRIVVNDFLLPATNAAVFEVFNDIQMITFAGMERTEVQWRHLLTSVGLTVQSIQYPEPGAKTPECLIEAILERKQSEL